MLRRDFEARPDAPIEAINGQWLRIMAWFKPDLPAPVGAWGRFMQEHLERSERNFTGGSRNWTRDNHEDGNAPFKALLRGLKQRGWYWPGQPLSPRDAERRDEAERKYRKRLGIRTMSPDERPKYLLDPSVMRWRPWSEIDALRNGAHGADAFLAWSSVTQVLDVAGFWTEEEKRLAAENRRKLRQGLIPTPPIPEGKQPLTLKEEWDRIDKRIR